MDFIGKIWSKDVHMPDFMQEFPKSLIVFFGPGSSDKIAESLKSEKIVQVFIDKEDKILRVVVT